MTFVDLDPAVARAGGLACVCDPSRRTEGFAEGTWPLAAAFGLAIFAQAATLTALSVAGGYLAPRHAFATLPFAASFAGAACASFPASLLLDQFGRRAAFAIGASLGAAGGALAAHAIIARQFPELCVGSFWLGASLGFALFYRHAAAISGVGGSRSALAVLTGGATGALLAPLAIAISRWGMGPLADAGLPLLAASANLLALPLVLALPHHQYAEPAESRRRAAPDKAFAAALGLGALGWFAMTRMMAEAPSALIGCGFGAGSVAGAEGAHLLAMYAPIAAASLWPALAPTRWTLAAGTLLSLLSLVARGSATLPILAALTCAALGWSLLQVGVSCLLHDRGRRSALWLGAYDTCILASALAGICAPLARL